MDVEQSGAAEPDFQEAAQRVLVQNFSGVQQRLQAMLAEQPTALAAAVSELMTCLQFQEYLNGVLHFFQIHSLHEVCDAVLNWALQRANLWILLPCDNKKSF